MSDLSDKQAAAMEPLRAPSGREVIERVHAERLGQPRLRAVDPEMPADPAAEVERLTVLLASLEARIAEEQAARKKAGANANEMAVLVARVRNELSDERSARIAAEQTANEMAGLVAAENERARKAEDQLRIAWAQVPMFEQAELSPGKPSLRDRARRAAKRA
jgi:septal ring factor EnvC (AmiA/AmiB activator)